MAPCNDNTDSFDLEIKNLKISTLNVRGLKNNYKQNAILQAFKELDFDIIALQETHLCENEYFQIESKWDGPCLFSEGTNNSKGLCILFKNLFKNYKIETIFSNDRLLLCALEMGKNIFFIGNVYAPSTDKYTKINFLNYLKVILREHLNENQMKCLFLLGDFNCVMDNNKDIITGQPHSMDVIKCLNQLVDDNELIDLWRKDNFTTKEHTWSGCRPLVMRRIDFIFANKFLTPYITSCFIKSIGHTDHRLVSCNIEFYKFKRGKGSYKMNNLLFENQSFKLTMGKLIKDNKEEFKHLDPGLRWCIIKNKAKELAQLYGKYNKITQDETNIKLVEELNILEKQLANDKTNMELQNNILSIKNKLEIFNIEKAEAAKIRAKVEWIEEGEKCSKFF